MKAISLLLLVCSLYFVSASDAVDDPDVIVLTTSNFDSIVNKEELILVEFYAPWCGHCKHLAPEYAIAATKLKKNDPPILLAKVDATAESELGNRFGVRGYPTLKVFRNGNPSEYNGPREANGIIEYMKKQVGPSAKPLKSKDQIEKFINDRDVSIIGFFPTKTGASYQNFLATADQLREKFRFGLVTSQIIMTEMEFGQSIVVFRPFDEKNSKVVYGGADTTSALSDFIFEYSLPLVGEYSKETDDRYKKRGLPILKAYIDVDFGSNIKRTNYYINRLKKAIEDKELQKKISVTVASKDKLSEEMEKFGVGATSGLNPDVRIVIDDWKNSQKYRFTGEFNIQNVQNFIKDFVSGKLKPYIKSGPIPADSGAGSVKVVVGETFQDVVLDKTKDVLFEMYAPWCGHCKSLEPIYKDLAQKFKDVDSVVIAKMDATENDSTHPAYQAKGFPTIFFAPANSKDKPIPYDGERNVKDMYNFVKKNASIKIIKDEL